MNGIECFPDEPVKRSAHSQELTPASRLGPWGALRSRIGSSRRGPIGYLSGLGEALADVKAAGRKVFFVLLC